MTPIDLFGQVEEEPPQHGSNPPDPSRRVEEPPQSLDFNPAYAQSFERRKRGEELMKLRDRYGADYEPSESEEDFSSEDSDAEFVTPEVDAAILKTLARIKKQDPKLLQSEGNIFEEEEAQNAIAREQQLKRDRSRQSSNRQRPMHLSDYQRRALLRNPTQESDEDELPPEHYQPTPAEEAAALRDEMKQAFHAVVDDNDSRHPGCEDDVQNLLVLRDKRAEESEEEEEEYQRFLVEQVGSEDIQTALQLDSGVQQEDGAAKENGLARNTQEDDEFLRSYVLGRGWIDREAKKIPKYKQIINAGAQPTRSKSGLSGSNANVLGKTVIWDQHDEEDEEFVEKAEEFEADYNFRFENDAAVITHARDTGPTARRKDDGRKQAREALKARKDEEKRLRMEELRRMQELKKAEIIEKLDMIRKNAGAEDCNLDEMDLDSDFDPDSHDRRMGKVFDDGFYGKTDPDGKPVWEDDIEIDDIVPARVPAEAEEEEVDFEPGGDAYDPSVPRKKMSKKMKRLAKAQGKQRHVDPDDNEDEEEQEPERTQDFIDLEGLSPKSRKQKLMEALDDYHKLDFEDMIGDLPTRFKYTKTEATEWMTPEQILLATDAELNQVIGLKKLAPYRAMANDNKLANRKKKLKELRKKLKTRTWGEASNDHHSINNPLQSSSTATAPAEKTSERPAKKRKGKKERTKSKEAQEQHVPMQLED